MVSFNKENYTMTKKQHIIHLLFFATFLLTESCEDCGCRNCGYNYPCYATNTTILFKDGVAVDTFNFYDVQHTTFMNKCVSVKEVCLKNGPRCFSKDSVLNFFHTEKEYYDQGYFNVNDIIGNRCGLIVEHNDNNSAGTLFITPEGYKLLEYYDYDSVIMTYTFDQFMYHSDWEVNELLDSGYELQ